MLLLIVNLQSSQRMQDDAVVAEGFEAGGHSIVL